MHACIRNCKRVCVRTSRVYEGISFDGRGRSLWVAALLRKRDAKWSIVVDGLSSASYARVRVEFELREKDVQERSRDGNGAKPKPVPASASRTRRTAGGAGGAEGERLGRTSAPERYLLY